MTDTPTLWPAHRPPDRIRHGWRCTRRGARVETVRKDPVTGRGWVAMQCQECGHDDLAWRLTTQTTPPDAAA